MFEIIQVWKISIECKNQWVLRLLCTTWRNSRTTALEFWHIPLLVMEWSHCQFIVTQLKIVSAHFLFINTSFLGKSLHIRKMISVLGRANAFLASRSLLTLGPTGPKLRDHLFPGFETNWSRIRGPTGPFWLRDHLVEWSLTLCLTGPLLWDHLVPALKLNL